MPLIKSAFKINVKQQEMAKQKIYKSLYYEKNLFANILTSRGKYRFWKHK